MKKYFDKIRAKSLRYTLLGIIEINQSEKKIDCHQKIGRTYTVVIPTALLVSISMTFRWLNINKMKLTLIF